MPRYAVSVLASRRRPAPESRHLLVLADADTMADAELSALADARLPFPPGEGWSHFDVIALDVGPALSGVAVHEDDGEIDAGC